MSLSGDARLANLVGALATGLTDGVQDAATAAGGTDATFAAALVALLDFAPSGSVHGLSRIVGLTHSGGVRLVDRLANAGLVQRAAGGDARTVTIELTPQGRAMAEQVRSRRAATIAAALTGLTAEQRVDLLAACEVVVGNLTRHRLAQRAAGGRPAGGALCRLCDFEACGRDQGDCPAARVSAEA